VTVDGQDWPVVSYKVEAGVDKWQRVTLTFEADVVIEHPDR
jgi:hypothetical protein